MKSLVPETRKRGARLLYTNAYVPLSENVTVSCPTVESLPSRSRDSSDGMLFRSLEAECSGVSCRVLFRRETNLRRAATLKRARKGKETRGREETKEKKKEKRWKKT